jgi:general secretion pathway protein D
VVIPAALGVATTLLVLTSEAVAQADTVPQTPTGDTAQVSGQGALFEFQDADLSLVLNALAAAGGLSLVYGELPDRSVTLRLAQPVSADQIPTLLESIAQANGLTVVREGPILRLTSAEPSAVTTQATDSVPQRRLYVYRLQHARAPRLASTLQALFGGQSSTTAAGFGVTTQTLSQQLRSQAVQAVTPGAPPGDLDAAEPAVSAVPTQQIAALPGELIGEVQIVPEETTNSLLVRATPEDWQVIQDAVQALDLRPLQVLIEVVIAEVSRSSAFDVGLGAAAADVADNTSVAVEIGGAGSTSRSAGDLVLEAMRTGNVSVQGFLSLLATEGTVRVLSRPVIFAQNNQEARILIGDERPFIQVFRSLPTDAAVRDQVVQYRDVGTALSILPTINTAGYVNLFVTQEVSTATEETQFGAPIISTREASTQLFVQDSQTVVIGGLIDWQETQAESGIPLLKDIPLLGNLFKSQSTSLRRSELFIFLTARIVATDEDADRIRGRLENDAELLQPEGTGPNLRQFIQGTGQAPPDTDSTTPPGGADP